jgi:3-dehydroquinate synthase II
MSVTKSVASRGIHTDRVSIAFTSTKNRTTVSATFKPTRFERHGMTRSVWLKADDSVGDWEQRKNRIVAGLEAGVDWVLCDEGDVSRVRDLGAVSVAAFTNGGIDVVSDVESGPDATVVGKDGEGDGTADLPPDLSGSADLSTVRRGDADGAYVRVFNEDYEAFAESAAEAADYTIVVGEDWTIIPLENLIARIGDETELVAGVESAEEARTAFETLETGADGVLLDSDDPDEIRRTVEVRDDADREHLDLQWAEVTEIDQVGSADRVCVDTGSLMDSDEGMLVGSMSRGLFFVHAETAESPYVASRPFRVNAGAVHAYARTPDGGTKYLSELGSGDEVQIVDTEGQAREALVGRAKIERRPMFRIEAEVATESDGGEVDEAESATRDRIETLLQNAETIKVATRDGPRAVTDLEVGDEVRVYYEETARHFGEAVEEQIIEK